MTIEQTVAKIKADQAEAAAKTPGTLAVYQGANDGVELPPSSNRASGVHQPMPEVAGDHLNCQRFLQAHGPGVRFSRELGTWYRWNGSWLEEDRTGVVKGLAAETVNDLRKWVAESDNADEMKRRAAHYSASSRSGRHNSLLDLASTDSAIRVSVDQLDSHPMMLACLNGAVNLATGELLPADPDQLLTRGVNVDYDPEAQSDLWDAFIRTIFDDDLELAGYVQRLLGYCTTGMIRDHVLAVFHGQGANGKSVLINSVKKILGEHAMTAPEGLLIRQKHEPHPERIASLRGRRLVVSNELEEKAQLAEQMVKQLTGGDDLTAREMNGRRFTFPPTFKVLMVTNHKPRVTGTDHAIWRRLRLVPFTVTIPPEKDDKELTQRLVDEHAPAILTWLVQGARAWHHDGLGTCAAVDVATEEYRESQDRFGIFMAECTEESHGARTKVGDLWSRWRDWCEQAREVTGRKQDFSAALLEHGVRIEPYQGTQYVRQIAVIPAQGTFGGVS